MGENPEGAVADGRPGSPQFIPTFSQGKTGFLKQQSFDFQVEKRDTILDVKKKISELLEVF